MINRRVERTLRRDLLRRLGAEVRQLREDAGRSQAAVARAAGIAPSYLSGIEGATVEASVTVLNSLAVALGCDLSIRLFPNTGPRLRDRHQLAIGEGLLSILHARWGPLPEVAVYRPIRGVIDLVLNDPTERLAVASEIQSQLRRIEQQVRWSTQKADALAALPEYAHVRVGRLLVVRNTVAMRDAVKAAAHLLGAAYPARAADAFASLAGTDPWPGNALLWANVERGRATLLDRPPRGIGVGR